MCAKYRKCIAIRINFRYNGGQKCRRIEAAAEREIGEMTMDAALYQTYVRILHEELVPAMGCTEPIAIAYAGALARKTLERLPERIDA